MALTVEDGSLVAGADSYVTRADFITFAAARGVTVTDDVTADEYLLKAAEYIDRHESNLKGTLVDRDQAMAFPRNDVYVDSWYWSNTEIPRQVILCQMAFALDIRDGVDLYNRPQNPNLVAKKQKVDVVEVEYAVEKNPQKLSQTSTGDALLASLLRNNGLVQLIRS